MNKEFSKNIEFYFLFYPMIHFIEVLLGLIWIVKGGGILSVGIFLFVLFIQSPLICQYLMKTYKSPRSLSYFGKNADKGNLWFAFYQLQTIYNTYPFIEKTLIIFPGLYSYWLRLWGGQIGEKVNWTPGCIIVDRTHLKIGDRCLIGNQCYLSAHAIKKKNGKYLLYVKRPEIGEDTVLAFRVTVGPGAVIGDRCFVAAGASIYPNQKLKDGETYERFEELSDERFAFIFAGNRKGPSSPTDS